MFKKKAKAFSAIFVILAAALPFSMYVAHATPSADVVGKIYVTALADIEGREAGNSDNTIVTLSVTSMWTGGIAGVSTSESRWIWHSYVPPYGGGPINAHSLNTMASAAVKINGATYRGSLTMLFLGSLDNLLSGAKGKGTWVITGGTGGLANLHGQGTWFDDGSPGSDYVGQVHFDP